MDSTFPPSELPPEAPSPQSDSPTVGASILWLLAAGGAYLLASIVYGIVYGIIASIGLVSLPSNDLTQSIQEHLNSLTGTSALYATMFLCLMPLFIYAANAPSKNFKSTLALNPTTWPIVAKWVGIWAILILVEYLILQVIPMTPEAFTTKASGTKHIGFTIVIITLAPILEETLFRGYLFKAWRPTKLGAGGTILLTSILFTALHAPQYSLFSLIEIFALALIMGYARERTGTLYVPLAIHAANNLYFAITVIFLGES